MRGRALRLLVPCFALATFAATPAVAQTPAPGPGPGPASPAPAGPQPGATDTRALAETLFFTARGLMEAGRYAEACGKLNESYRLDAAAGTLLNLAVCNEKIGKLASAWGEFRDAQAEARRMSRPDREQLATDRIKAIEPELPFLTVTVPPMVRALRGIEISRNGIPLQSAAWDTDLPVDPGEVEVVEHAPGYKPKTLKVTVAARQHATISAEPLELAPIERPPPPFWTAKRTTGFALMAGGLVAAGAGAFFGLRATSEKKDSDGLCPKDSLGNLRCSSTGVDDMNQAKVSAWASDIALGVAVVGFGLGSYLFFTGGAHQEDPTRAATGNWRWVLGATPKGAGGWLTRSF
ncbi:MAG TPA: hypothetical protein VGG39_12125 [Polyangiaceae bacterium]|jgi:hypothetical protein